MFNKTYINKTESNPVTRIIEKSVSPDKVADLYLEAKKEVTEQLLDTIHVKNNIFESAYMRFRDPRTLEVVIKWKIAINGKDFTGNVSGKDVDTLQQDPVLFFANKILESQAREILKSIT